VAPRAATQRWYLRQLQSYNVSGELQEIPKPIGNTFRWVLQSPEFTKWAAQQQNAVLLIVGQPGCGKTVLSAFLYGEFQDKQRAYFACKEGEDIRRKPAMILSSLLHQILVDQPHLFQYAMKDDQSPQNWPYKQLLDSFDAVINSPDHKGIVCLIDALDECHLSYRKQFVRDLKRVFLQNGGRNSGYARLIVTARENYDDIDNLTSNRLNLDISPAMKSDLHVFVQHRINDLVALRPEYERRSTFLVERLEAQANGMYRLVELLIDDLENSTDSSDDGIQQILNTVPGDIAEVYNTIWAKIPLESRPRAQKIFTWLLCSLKPLTKEEIAIAIAVEFLDLKHQVQVRKIDISKDILGDLRRLFGPLIRVRTTIELSHQTVRSHFLKQPEEATDGKTIYGIDACEAHSSIAFACLRFLNAEEFEIASKNILNCQNGGSMQFLDYSLRFMSQHVALSTSQSHIYGDNVIEFFDRKVWLGKWTQNLKPGTLPVSQTLWRPKITNAVSFACQLNLPKLLSRLLSSELTYMSGEEDCSNIFHLLYEAVVGGGEECVSLMVQAFDQIMLETPLECTLLLQRTAWSSVESGERYGHDVDVILTAHEDLEGHSLKHKYRFEELLQIIREKQQKGQKIIRSESEVEVLKQKVLKAYRIISPATSDRELLSNAYAETLYNSTLLFCLYITWTYGKYATELLIDESPAMFEAIKSGHYLAVKLLIQEGAGISFCDSDGTTALHWAARTGNAEIVKLVLKKNSISVNSTNEKGLTPLHFACLPFTLWEASAVLEPGPKWISRARVVQLLLNSGAEVRARDQQGNTPFQTLARIYVPEWKEVPKDSELNWREQDLNECIDLLLNDVRDIIEWDSYGTTPFHYASYLWPISAIQQLLRFLDECYLAPTLLDYAGFSPLHYAAVRGFESPEEVVRLLAQAGVEARLRNVFGETALTIARRHGQVEVAEELESIHQALNDEARNRAFYQSWLSTPKSPFQVHQVYAPLNEPFPSMLNLMMKPRFMQLHGATEIYAGYPSTEVSQPVKNI
jgi:ankyrin repeat protein